MSQQVINNNSLPAVMQNKLQSVRWRQALFAFGRAAAIAATVLISGMVAAMAVDWWFTIFSTTVRTVLTSVTVVAGVVALLFSGMKPLIAAFRWNRAASNVDGKIPQLEERWTTVAHFANSKLPPESQTARAMLQQVTTEAVVMGALVKPATVVRPDFVKPAATALGVSVLVFALFMVANWGQTSVLLRRFWAPTADITATQLNSVSQDQTVPRGHALDLVTRMTGLLRNSATILVDIDEFGMEEIELLAEENSPDTFICRLDVDESFRYRVLSGDGRTEWHTVTAIDFPELADINLTVTPPEYVDQPPFQKKLIPGRLKAIEGSYLKLEMRPDDVLTSFELLLNFGGEESEPEKLVLKPDLDGWYRYETQIVEDFTLSPLFENRHQLTNEDRRICKVHVVADKAPVARVISPTEEIAVNASDVLDVKFEAHDDHGIATAELVVYDETNRKEGEDPTILMVQEIPLGDQKFRKHIMGLAKLDLKALGLDEGQSISYAVRVTDNRNVQLNPEQIKQQRMAAAEKRERDSNKAARSDAEPREDSALAGDARKQEGDGAPNSPGEKNGREQKTGTENLLAVASDVKDARDVELQQEMLKNAVDQPSKDGDSGDGEPKGGKRADKHDSGEASDSKNDGPRPVVTMASKDEPQSPKGASAAKAGGSPKAGDSKASQKQSGERNDDVQEKNQEPKDQSKTKSPRAPRDGESEAGKNKKQNSGASTANGGQSKRPEDKDKKDEKDQDSRRDDDKNKMPPSPVSVQLQAQSSESGQKKETKRRRLKISSRLAAVARATKRQKKSDGAYREKLIDLDAMLAVVEGELTNLLKGVNQDQSRSDQFRKMDEQLGEVEQVVSDFRDETRDTEFVFVGQQLLVIKRTHVTPARDYVFAAIKEPDAAAESFAADANHHVMTAREQLQALTRKYDRVRRDRKLKRKIDESVTLYEVYVEKSQRLMRTSARGAKDPFERKMDVIEVDQAYLDRYAEVARLQRDLMDDFARLLSDDPRLLSKYMEMIKRRRASLWQQLTDLQTRQDEVTQEVSGWMHVADTQRQTLWLQFAELRLYTASDLVKEAVGLAERMESQLPLVLQAKRGTPALAIRIAKQIAVNARQCSLDARAVLKANGASENVKDLARNAERLVYQLGELEAALDQLSFDSGGKEDVAAYVDLRLAEGRVLADHADAWAESAASIQNQTFHLMAHVDQQQTAIATELLRIDMLGIETDLVPQFRDAEAGMPQELGEMTRELLRLMEAITFNQQSAAFSLKLNQISRAARQQELALAKFDEAVQLLKQLRRTTAAALDEIRTENPNIADLRDPTLDRFLAQLEREPNVEAQLGLPRRPRNLRQLASSMTWRSGGGGLGQGGGGGGGGLSDASGAALARIKREMQSKAAAKRKRQQQERRQQQELTEEEKQQQVAQAEAVKKMISQAQQQAEEQAENTNNTPAQREHAQQQAEKMRKMLQQMGDGDVPDGTWDRIAEAEETKAIMEALARGEAIPDEQWNKLQSSLDDGIGQANRRIPPEDYLPAIDLYQDAIRQLAP